MFFFDICCFLILSTAIPIILVKWDKIKKYWIQDEPEETPIEIDPKTEPEEKPIDYVYWIETDLWRYPQFQKAYKVPAYELWQHILSLKNIHYIILGKHFNGLDVFITNEENYAVVKEFSMNPIKLKDALNKAN